MSSTRCELELFWVLVLCIVSGDAGFCKTNLHHETCDLIVYQNKTDKLLCSGTLDRKFYRVVKLKALVLCNVAQTDFDPTLINHFSNLHRFSLISSNVSHFSRVFPPHKQLQHLNLTRLRLEWLQLNLFVELKSLRVLDLSHNRLRTFQKYLVDPFLPNIQQIFLKEQFCFVDLGDNYECNTEMRWAVSKKGVLAKKVVDLNQLHCGNTTYPGKPLVPVMVFIKALELECPKIDGHHCSCHLDNVVTSPTDRSLVPLTTVNCSNLGLTSLPVAVPNNTTTLLLNYNHIRDLTPLAKNHLYRGVSDIYLDHNEVESVDELEGADWLTTFRVFSLRNNKLKSLPTYAFDYAFERNLHLAKVYFGENPWDCDCYFTPGFQELLVKYQPVIGDSNDIRCSPDESNPNSMKKIRELTVSAFCRSTDDSLPLSGLDFLNVALGLAIIFMFAKLGYDFWMFRTTARLPWIVTKIP